MASERSQTTAVTECIMYNGSQNRGMATSLSGLSISGLREWYQSGNTPEDLVDALLSDWHGPDEDNVWITRRSKDAIRERAATLTVRSFDFERAPLYGIPFAVKDNVDVKDMATTAGCPEYAYTPEKDATVVKRLRDAGAILVGKTNMDQFATGLVGTRSPYGETHNAFDPTYISGGSSSGSAVAVAKGLVAFALGTDTAGSGRVPAAMNHVVGLKPTRGVIPTDGVVPACRSLDCVSVFATSAADALLVEQTVAGPSEADPYSRRDPPNLDASDGGVPDSFRFGVPTDLEFFGDNATAERYRNAVSVLESMGGTPVDVDPDPFLEVGSLLYDGPWLAERYAAVGDFIDANPESVLPVTRDIIRSGRGYSAVEAFEAMYERQAIATAVERELAEIDFLCVPTVGTIYTREAIGRHPVELNSKLGRYTNFLNLLDQSGVAIPTGTRQSGPHEGLPTGVTLIAGSGEEAPLVVFGDELPRQLELSPGVPGLHDGWHGPSFETPIGR